MLWKQGTGLFLLILNLANAGIGVPPLQAERSAIGSPDGLAGAVVSPRLSISANWDHPCQSGISVVTFSPRLRASMRVSACTDAAARLNFGSCEDDDP